MRAFFNLPEIWLFGEASVNTDNSPKSEYKRLWNVAENCGYFVEAFKEVKDRRSAHIVVLGEDVPEGYQLESVLNFGKKDGIEKFTKIQKVLYKISYEGLGRDQKQIKKMIKVFDYLGGEFVEVFDLEKHEISLKGDVNYQRALAKEGKKDHPLYTGNGVEKRKCTCIDGDECHYFACANCKSQKIEFGNYSHKCLDCNRLQDVTVLDPFIVCEKHGKFDRDDQECPKCMREFNS